MLRYARKNFWRVEGVYDLDDLIQDGFLCWQIVLRNYPDITERKHLMSLFQRTFSNYIHDLSTDRTHDVETLESLWFGTRNVFEEELGTILTLITRAPEPIRKTLEVLATEEGRKRLRSVSRVRRDGTRETLNERLCRLTGSDPQEINIPDALREYFGPS